MILRLFLAPNFFTARQKACLHHLTTTTTLVLSYTSLSIYLAGWQIIDFKTYFEFLLLRLLLKRKKEKKESFFICRADKENQKETE